MHSSRPSPARQVTEVKSATFLSGRLFQATPRDGSYCTGAGKKCRVGRGRGFWCSYAEARLFRFVKARIPCADARNAANEVAERAPPDWWGHPSLRDFHHSL